MERLFYPRGSLLGEGVGSSHLYPYFLGTTREVYQLYSFLSLGGQALWVAALAVLCWTGLMFLELKYF